MHVEATMAYSRPFATCLLLLAFYSCSLVLATEDYRVAGNVRLCFDCDATCEKYLVWHNGWRDYFKRVVARVTEIFKSNHIPLTFSLRRVYLLRKDLKLAEYLTKGTTAFIHNANTNYWKTRLRYIRSCDMSFLTSFDSFFDDHNFAGHALYNSMCSDRAYGLLQMNFKFDMFIANILHEIGHTIGMYHRTATLPESIRSCGVLKACYRPKCYDPSGRCIMDTYLKANAHSTKYSDCAKAMFKHWTKHYKTSCIR